MSPSPSRLNLRQLSCWLQVILLAWGMGSMVQPVSGSQVLPRLETETVTDPEQGTTVTAYAYDAANNRASKTVQGGSEPGFWEHDYNAANQLVSWRKLAGPWGTLLKEATLGYDANGNRSEQTVTDVATSTAAVTQYSWDAQDRLSVVEMPDGQVHGYEYDYRTRRTGISRAGGQQGGVGTVTAVVFSGGLSLAEWETTGNSEPGTENPPSVHYTRGPDMGGGVGGLLYSWRGETLKYNLGNGRGDVVAQSNTQGELTWTASYEAYGKRTKETGENADKQRANTKDEDPTGLLNEGFRYRDLETGVWLSRDPAGFVDGPNLYAYVKQNPWTSWDPDGLKSKSDYRRDMARATERRSADLKRLPSNASDRARFGIENRYQKAMRKAQQGIDSIIKTARQMEAVMRSQTGSIDDEFLDDENDTYTSFNRISMLGAVLPIKFGEHVNHGEYGAAAKEFGKDVVIGLAFAAAGKALAAAGRMGPGGKILSKCFAAGTDVLTPDGGKNIEEIKEGDIIFAFDFETKKAVERRVLETVSNFTHYWADVEVAGEVLQATRGHKFWVESEDEWIDASSLTSGMIVRLSDGRTSAITKVTVRALSTPETTYNLIVEEEHNYFVGTNHVLVHNGYPESPQYPPATKVGETFQFNFDTSEDYANSRAAGVRRAKAAGLIGPNDIGHHINSVQTHPHLAAEPGNIAPEPTRASHLQTHGGNWKNSTSGPLNAACP